MSRHFVAMALGLICREIYNTVAKETIKAL